MDATAQSLPPYPPQAWFPPQILGLAYQKEEYLLRPRTDRVKKCWLHFLIALDQPDAYIIQQINKANPVALLVHDDKASNFTPMHLAAIKVKPAIAAAIWERLKSVPMANVQCAIAHDECGWTPGHLAALTSPEIERMLGKTEKKTFVNGTVEDIRALAGIRPLAYTDTASLLCLPGQKETFISALTYNDLKSRARFRISTDRVIHPPHYWIKLWAQRPVESKEITSKTIYQQQLIKACERAREKPALLMVMECPELKKGNIPLCLGLYAGGKKEDKIHQGQVIRLEAGLYVPFQATPSFQSLAQLIAFQNAKPFLFGEVDAQDVGNDLRFCNSGWPTAMVVDVPNFEGRANTIAVIALHDLKAGDEIRIPYGQKKLAFILGTQVPLGLNEAHRYFERGLESLIEEIEKTRALLRKAIEAAKLNQIEEFHFLFNAQDQYLTFVVQNPVFLFDLHFRGKVHVEEWIEAIYAKRIQGFALQQKQNAYSSEILMSIIQRLREFERANLTKAQREFAAQWVLKSLGAMPLVNILKALQLMLQGFNENMENYLQRFLSEYDWTLDEEGPLGWKTRADDARVAKLRTMPPEDLLEELEKKIEKSDTSEYQKSLHYQIQQLKANYKLDPKNV